MLRHSLQIVAGLLVCVLLGSPLAVCLTPGRAMTVAEHHCCVKMAGACEVSAMPSSHSCCSHPGSRETVQVSRIQIGNFEVALVALSEASLPLPVPMVSGDPNRFKFPPESPPPTVFVLRI